MVVRHVWDESVYFQSDKYNFKCLNLIFVRDRSVIIQTSKCKKKKKYVNPFLQYLNVAIQPRLHSCTWR